MITGNNMSDIRKEVDALALDHVNLQKHRKVHTLSSGHVPVPDLRPGRMLYCRLYFLWDGV